VSSYSCNDSDDDYVDNIIIMLMMIMILIMVMVNVVMMTMYGCDAVLMHLVSSFFLLVD
jgi:hypothetical protein